MKRAFINFVWSLLVPYSAVMRVDNSIQIKCASSENQTFLIQSLPFPISCRNRKHIANLAAFSALLSSCTVWHFYGFFIKSFLSIVKGPSTLATLFSHRWPHFCGGPEHTRATCGGDIKIIIRKWYVATKTLCLWRGRATACRTLEPQTAACSPKLDNNGFLRE